MKNKVGRPSYDQPNKALCLRCDCVALVLPASNNNDEGLLLGKVRGGELRESLKKMSLIYLYIQTRNQRLDPTNLAHRIRGFLGGC